jgi:signal transduction histidine kinase
MSKPNPVTRWYRDISISSKLYFAVGVMALLIAIELFTLWFSIGTLSSVRAFVGGEGLWSKAQKDAIYHLGKYAKSEKEEDYADFLKFLKVPMGDRKARIEMLKQEPDLKIVREGFIEGRNHPDDIDGMINLFRRFYNIYYIDKAIKVWTAADSTISIMQGSAQQLHEIIRAGGPEKTALLQKKLEEINVLNKKITILEDEFSATLGEGSRWLERLVLEILLLIALTVEISGLLLSISISRNISKGINAIVKFSQEAAEGNFKNKIPIHSKDEIGKLAGSVNQMTGDLEQKITALQNAEQVMRENKDELSRSNKELQQFAYIASHDLQEPLRTISNYVGLFHKQYQGKLDKKSDDYLEYISAATSRMQALIKDLLEYSTLGNNKSMLEADCNLIIQEVMQDMHVSIEESKAEINTESLPSVHIPREVKSVFQNLISNAIKFKYPGKNPVIHIQAKKSGHEWIFSIHDNGIGIDPKYHERIFTIFQKLHTHKEFAGTGIGLAHSKKIIELCGGKMWVESAPDIGSTFYFSLPENDRT